MAVVRRDLAHPLVPTVAAALLGVAYLIAAPETADMAAHTYRTWLWNQVGFATWNAQWYGGHHMAGYSLLYPPLAAVAGTRLVGVVAAVVAVGLFAVLARRLAPTRASAALASWLFLGGVMSNVVIGRMPFTLGIAFAVAAWACARRSWPAAAVLALASTWASPVAGVFLCVAALAIVAGARLREDPERPDWRTALALGVPAVAGGLLMALFFPEGGTDRFVLDAFWPGLVCAIGAVALIDRTHRTAYVGAVLYLIVLVAAFALPNGLGQNALRPGAVRRDPRWWRLWRSWASSSTCSGCRPCARSTRRAATRPPRPRSTRRCSTICTSTRGRASGSRCRSHATTGRRPTSRRTSRSPAAGTASSTARSTRSSTTARACRPGATTGGCATTPCAGSRCRPRRWTSRRAPRRR